MYGCVTRASADRVEVAFEKGLPRTNERVTGTSCSTQREPIVITVQPSNVQGRMIIGLPFPKCACLDMPLLAGVETSATPAKGLRYEMGADAQASSRRSQLSGSSRRASAAAWASSVRAAAVDSNAGSRTKCGPSRVRWSRSASQQVPTVG